MSSKNPKNKISISLPGKSQKIFVGSNLLDWVIKELSLKRYSGFIVFYDKNFLKIYKDLLYKLDQKLKPLDIILVEPNENSKSFVFLNFALDRCTKANLNRRGCFIALGGGIVGDVAGFLASVYMRGIDMVFIPTTLMAQGDTIINKVAISHKLIKNIIGSFYSPNITVCDADFLQSLPEEEISLGLSEIIKHALIYSKPFADHLLKVLPLIMSHPKIYDRWNEIIFKSIKIKGAFVEKDPCDELGTHKGLSYGHTLANALEGLSEFNLRHGEAVALGMRISATISHSMGILSTKDFETQEKLLNIAKLPSKFPYFIELDHIVSLLRKDKISSHNEINLVILEKIGKHRIIKNVNEKIIKNALIKFQP
ncbi:3-dehydroquinate synthase [Candidatus Nomurabacteria bacterium]|nr:3-dehydroquinate synthase [Candidatus Nomurabacteria bacterium]